MADESHISMTVPSRLDHLDLLQAVSERIARIAGFDENGVLDLGLAVREGAINAMKHAHRFDADIPVALDFRLHDATLEISIVDRGPGFDPSAQPDPREPENLLRSCGRGLFLIRSLVDDLNFIPREPGMEVVLIKRGAPRRVDEPSP